MRSGSSTDLENVPLSPGFHTPATGFRARLHGCAASCKRAQRVVWSETRPETDERRGDAPMRALCRRRGASAPTPAASASTAFAIGTRLRGCDLATRDGRPRQSCAETPVGPRPSRSQCRRQGARELGDRSRSEAIVGPLTRFPGQAVLSRHIGMEESQGRSAHTSQRCPPGSWKFVVRIPNGRSIGPLSMRTPRCASCRQRAST